MHWPSAWDLEVHKQQEVAKGELEVKIACEKLAKPKTGAEFMTFRLCRFCTLDVRQKPHGRRLIDTVINAIFLYDDKMVITFSYKEGTSTITFDDLKVTPSAGEPGPDLDRLTAPKTGDTQRVSPVFSAPPFAYGKKRSLRRAD